MRWPCSSRIVLHASTRASADVRYSTLKMRSAANANRSHGAHTAHTAHTRHRTHRTPQPPHKRRIAISASGVRVNETRKGELERGIARFAARALTMVTHHRTCVTKQHRKTFLFLLTILLSNAALLSDQTKRADSDVILPRAMPPPGSGHPAQSKRGLHVGPHSSFKGGSSAKRTGTPPSTGVSERMHQCKLLRVTGASGGRTCST